RLGGPDQVGHGVLHGTSSRCSTLPRNGENVSRSHLPPSFTIRTIFVRFGRDWQTTCNCARLTLLPGSADSPLRASPPRTAATRRSHKELDSGLRPSRSKAIHSLMDLPSDTEILSAMSPVSLHAATLIWARSVVTSL